MMNAKILISAVAVSTCLGISYQAQSAAVLESFDYTDTATLDGQGAAGSGWAGAWSQGGGATTTATIASLGLTHPNVSSAGNKAVITPTGSSTFLTRSLSDTYGADGTTTYISFLGERLNDANTTTRFFGLKLAGSSNGLLIGQKSFGSKWGIVAGSTSVDSTVDTLDAALIVVRLDAVAGADTLTLWVNPDLSLTEASNTPAAQITTVDIGTFNSVRLDASETAIPGADYEIDEISISNEGSPFVVPEPASLMLLGLAMPLLACRRGR
ncbi:PEP-CTERM sorting domain-containing protein [Poriferisphaera sp. WC338]|uniref:PEP-CTERM sorting domain-containing protein n=1 Tax=Poriferisphaera sp. WC338 TaxID=3425129 RepID=UPI003D812B8D